MTLRFRRSIKEIASGVHLNIGKKGDSFTFGGPGALLNFGRRGVNSTIGIPGTGISYRSKIIGNSPVSKRTLSADFDLMNLLTAAQKMVEGEQIRRAIKSLALQKDGSITFERCAWK